jgi:hypothetical protein
MFDFLKSRKDKSPKEEPQMADLESKPLKEGDIVEVLRYDMGKSRVFMSDKGLSYESMENGKVISWHYMVDAATGMQKVKKIGDS